MSPKIYTQEFKEAVVKYYERNHTIAETLKEFGVSQTSLFEWKKLYDQEHDHHLYTTPEELVAVMEEYIHFYNEERPHRKLNMKTPLEFETEYHKG